MKKQPITEKGKKLLRVRKIIKIIGTLPIWSLFLVIALGLFIDIENAFMAGLATLMGLLIFPALILTMFSLSILDRYYHEIEGNAHN